jgi:hypothetical protein
VSSGSGTGLGAAQRTTSSTAAAGSSQRGACAPAWVCHVSARMGLGSRMGAGFLPTEVGGTSDIDADHQQ